MRLRALGVGLAVATLGCASLGSPPAAPVLAAKVVRITGFRFVPAEIVVSPGDTVVWVNDDAFAHTATADNRDWSSVELVKAGRFVLVARAAGRYPYHCAAHPGMSAVLLVRPAP